MDVLSHYSSPIVEFPATQPLEKQHALVDNCTGTDPPPPSKDAATGTQEKLHVATQTEQRVVSSKDVEYDERALAKWLRQICPMVERELMNPTPLMEDLTMSQCRLEVILYIKATWIKSKSHIHRRTYVISIIFQFRLGQGCPKKYKIVLSINLSCIQLTWMKVTSKLASSRDRPVLSRTDCRTFPID